MAVTEAHAVMPIFQKFERFHLDADSPIPLYHQMEKIILDRISKPEMLDRMLPPEFELIDIFGVSRATVKKTLDNLVGKGLLERRRGIGTRVVKHQIIEDLARLKGYTEEMESRGLRISTKVLDVIEHVPDVMIQQKLGLAEGERTISIQRLRGTSEVFPVVLLRSEIPVAYGIDIKDDFSQSLYRLLEQKYDRAILWAEETIEAATATREQAKFLEIKTGDTVLIIQRVTYTHNNHPLEYVKGVYRPDHYKFSIRLRR